MAPTVRRVLIVDDHRPFRALARELLELDGYTVVGDAGTAAEGVDAATRLRPDLVLLDIGLPDADGFEVARQLAQLEDPPIVVLVSSRDSSAYRRRLAGSPVRGFLPKGELTVAALAGLIGSTVSPHPRGPADQRQLAPDDSVAG